MFILLWGQNISSEDNEKRFKYSPIDGVQEQTEKPAI